MARACSLGKTSNTKNTGKLRRVQGKKHTDKQSQFFEARRPRTMYVLLGKLSGSRPQARVTCRDPRLPPPSLNARGRRPSSGSSVYQARCGPRGFACLFCPGDFFRGVLSSHLLGLVILSEAAAEANSRPARDSSTPAADAHELLAIILGINPIAEHVDLSGLVRRLQY